MGFELGIDPKILIERMLVRSYLLKWLRVSQQGFDIGASIQQDISNIRALLSQGGVQFLNRKLMVDTIRVRYQYKQQVYAVDYRKAGLIEQASQIFTDLKRQNFNVRWHY